MNTNLEILDSIELLFGSTHISKYRKAPKNRSVNNNKAKNYIYKIKIILIY
jgi:hypothetical protein